MANPIGNLGTIPTLSVGNHVYTDLTNLIVLHGYAVGAHNCTLRKGAASAGYQTTTGKTLTISMIHMQQNNGTQGQITLSYSDNDVGLDSSTSLTNGVNVIGSAATPWLSGNTTAGAEFTKACSFGVPSQKYTTVVGINASAQTILDAFGYEA